MSKRPDIAKSLAQTKLKRATQEIKVFEVKVDESHLSKKKEDKLRLSFIQAKWIYNFCLSQENIFDLDYKRKTIPVNIFNKETGLCDLIENRNINLGSQIKQSLYKQVQQNIINLSKAKKKGSGIGKLKYKKEVNRIHLKQYGTTYRIKNKNYIYVQEIGRLKVLGLEQVLAGEYDIACADLIKKSSGYYFKICCYKNKETPIRRGEIGIDMGIKDTVVLSNGEKYNFNFELPNKIIKKHKKLSKMRRGSGNYIKQCEKLKKSYEEWGNKKNDAANKFVSSLKQYEKIVIQDENLKGWSSGLFGKKISTSILGRIKSRVKNLPTAVIIDRYLPTTKICPKCLAENNIKLRERTYKCSCGLSEDRDIKSAKTILCLGNKEKTYTSKELRGLPVEDLAAVFKDYIFEGKLEPMKQEALVL